MSKGSLHRLVAGVGLAASTMAAATPNSAEVDYLLDRVVASDCTFIRNGKRYDGADAASHLRRKYDYAQRKHGDITADQFIEHIATKSSWSGRLYTVECPPQYAEQRSADWLTQMLDQHRAGSK